MATLSLELPGGSRQPRRVIPVYAGIQPRRVIPAYAGIQPRRVIPV
jgi:hypothetical protein